MEYTGNHYSIRQLAQFTGLTDRTIRNYISSGILQGEKTNGLWHFTLEQVEHFICHPTVRPSILAKQHSAVYDFLLDNKKSSCEICIMMDLPGKNEEDISQYFCSRINDGAYSNLTFSLDSAAEVPRIILKGHAAEVLQLVNGYTAEYPLS